MKTLDLQRWKKTSTSTFAYCSKWFRNWIPFIHTSESQIQQLQAFFESNYCNLKCDCEWIKIPFLFLENSFANVSNSILYVQKWKRFWRLHPSFENKKGRMKSGLQWLYSTLSSLSYVFEFEAKVASDHLHLCFNRQIPH